MTRPDIPSTFTFTANVCERDIVALLQDHREQPLKDWGLPFSVQGSFTARMGKRRPDEVKVKVTYEIPGITDRQRKIFLQAMRDKSKSPDYSKPWGPARGDV